MTTKKGRDEKITLILRKAVSVSKELEALTKEHETILSDLKKPLESDGVGSKDEVFETMLRERKEHAVNQALDTLRKGMDQIEMMAKAAEYISSLEADKVKLETQVKRLCGENSWLRKSLTETQQLLQEAEVSMSKLLVEKEHLEFLLSQKKSGSNDAHDLRSLSSVDEREEEARSAEEVADLSVSLQMTGPVCVGGRPDITDLDSSLDYDMPENIKKLHQLALQYVSQGMHEVAVPLCRKAIQDLEQRAGRNSPDLASLLNLLAVIYREQGRFKEAIRVLRETLEIRENVFGMSHSVVASTLNNLSVLYCKCGDYKTAEPFCQRALEIRQELLGPNHPDVAKQFCNLAVLCSHLGRYEEMEHYNQRALDIFQVELDHDDPNITKTMNNLANCYLKQGKYKAAEAMFKKVLHSVQREEHTKKDVSTNGSGNNMLDDGEYGHWYKISPVQSPTVKDTLRSLTDIYRGQGRMEDAAKLERLSRQSSSERAQGELLFSQLLDEVEAANTGNVKANTSPKKTAGSKQNQHQPHTRSPLKLQGWLFQRSPAVQLSEPSKQHGHF